MAITSTSFGQSSNNSNPTITFGFTANAGDLIVIGAAQDGGTQNFTWGGSWVELVDGTHTGFGYTCGYLIAAGGETETTNLSSSTSERWEVVIFRIPAGEWHGTTPPEVSTPVEGSSTGPNAGAINASWTFDTANIAITFAARDDSAANTITAYPTNYGTAQIDKNDVTSAANIGGAARTDAADNEDAGAFTISATETWAAWTVAIRPAGVSTTTFTPAPVVATLTVPAPTLALTLAFAPAPVPAVLAVPAPTFGLSLAFAPAPVPAVLAVPAPTLVTPLDLAPAPIPVVLVVTNTTISTVSDTTLTPDPVAVTLAVPAPTLGLTYTIEPSPVAVVLTVTTPTLGLTLDLSPAPVAAVLAVPAPTLSTILDLSPSPVAVILGVPAPVLQLLINLSPSPVAAVLAVPNSTLSAASDQTLTPSPVAVVLSVPAPTLNLDLAFGGSALDTSPRVRFYWYKGLNRGNPRRR